MATEEQTQENGWSACLRGDTQTRGGQRLTISNRRVTKLGFLAYKVGSPTGDLTFTIRRVSNDSIIVSKVWGDLSSLGAYPGVYEEVVFDNPVTINEEVRILGEVSTGDADNRGALAGYSTNVKDDEHATLYTDSWIDSSPSDLYYIYTYMKISPLPIHFR